ncbi:hypothetical protein EXIGLDRAFT_773323 [Exidia glandulosa HHB12029]|uniref:F-box domain-containing protein n=1 Tax=Exidia glandulosa HHB12029 TaxID=1314781 RepID=A0A166A1V8_EXIGL|nr:hypothetical protein EXIGLDRAFT_773323 [Exidia glandulosa HHB12029]
MSYLPLPTATETQATRALIDSHYDEIDAVKLEIQDLESEIEARVAKITRIHNAIAEKKSFIAPIRRLPFDVLSEIVVAAASDPETSVGALRTLSSLCRTWRDATLRTPRVWTNITYRRPKRRAGPSALHSVRDVRRWFLRSGTCPKDVAFLCHDIPLAKQQAIYELVLANVSSLRSLSIVVDDAEKEALQAIQKILSKPMPLLEHLDMTSQWRLLEPEADPLSIFSVPRLSSVALRMLSTSNRLPDIVRMQLRNLYLAFADVDPLLEVLRAGNDFPGLESLQIASLHNWSIDIVPFNLDLRVLYLGLHGQRSGPSFLSGVITPRLERLALRAVNSYASEMPTYDVAKMLGHVSRSHPPLRELHLQGYSPKSNHVIIDFLRNVPCLERLVLLAIKSSDDLCEALSTPQRRGGGWLCPRLTHLCIGNAYPTKAHKERVSRAGMLELARARSVATDVSTLRYVRLDTFELYSVGTAWQWGSEQPQDYDDALESSDPEPSKDDNDSIFPDASFPTAPSWWQVGVSPYRNYLDN